MKMKHMRLPAAVLGCVLIASMAWAQDSAPPPAAQRQTSQSTSPPKVPLQVRVVLSRYLGEKRVSSLPYTLTVTANNEGPNMPARLRMGAQVPVPSGAFGNGPDGKPVGPVNYRDIGTNIDVWAVSTPESQFQINLLIEDTTVYVNSQVSPEAPRVGELPVFRSFRYSNSFALRDGQTSQFTAAADRVSGEVVRVDVTLNVVK